MRFLPVIALLVLAGCATAAQRQVQQTGIVLREAKAQLTACISAVIAKPEYAPLLPHTPDPATGQPTMAQLTDETFISPEDAKLFATRHDEVTSCATHFLNALSPVRPDVVPILTDEHTRATVNGVQLVERKITWGEFARQAQALSSDTRQKLAAADREWRGDLNAAHQAEMAQRQAAGAALMQWSAQQQMINAMNRPVTTNCSAFGSQVNCISR